MSVIDLLLGPYTDHYFHFTSLSQWYKSNPFRLSLYQLHNAWMVLPFCLLYGWHQKSGEKGYFYNLRCSPLKYREDSLFQKLQCARGQGSPGFNPTATIWRRAYLNHPIHNSTGVSFLIEHSHKWTDLSVFRYTHSLRPKICRDPRNKFRSTHPRTKSGTGS